MADRLVESDHGNVRTSRQSESAWIAHWKQTHSSSMLTGQTHSFLRPHSELKHNGDDAKPLPPLGSPEKTPAIAKFGEVSGTQVVDVMDDSVKASTGKFREERLNMQSFPMFGLLPKKESSLVLKNNPASSSHGGSMGPTSTHGGVMRPHTARVSNPTFGESKCHLLPFLEQSHCKKVSSSKEHGFDSVGFPWKQEQVVESRNVLEKNSLAALASFQENVGSSSKAYERNNGINSVPRLPIAVKDVETMRICTTVDSVETAFGGPSKFHTATSHFLFTAKTGYNLCEGGQAFRESLVSTKFKGKMFSEFLSLSPSFGFQNHYGLKPQSLGDSSGSKGKEHARDVNTSIICLKNETSAETDTMEMEDVPSNLFSGTDFSRLYKTVVGGPSSATSQAVVGSLGEENADGFSIPGLPDINQEIPALLAEPKSLDDRDTNSSRTQSLDMDNLLSNAEKPIIESVEPDPNSRWVKRLKLGSPDAFRALGTKNSKVGEASSDEKVNKFLNRIMKISPSRSKPAAGRHLGNGPLVPYHTAVLLKDDSSFSDPVRKGEDLILTHPWIRRWCQGSAASPVKKPEIVGVCEPQCSRSTFSDFQKKEFPSIAAMALMGKAMNAFRPCEFKKNGCFVVWNTKESGDN